MKPRILVENFTKGYVLFLSHFELAHKEVNAGVLLLATCPAFEGAVRTLEENLRTLALML